MPPERLNTTEEFYIKFYNTWKSGLNLTTGGDHYQISDETREKKRQQLLKNNPMRGKTHTDETKRKLSEISKSMPAETRRKIAKSRMGMKFSQATIEKRRKKLLGHSVAQHVRDAVRKANSKIVYQFDLNGKFIAEYPSVVEAKRQTGLKNIQHAASGITSTSGGFIWKYKQDIK